MKNLKNYKLPLVFEVLNFLLISSFATISLADATILQNSLSSYNGFYLQSKIDENNLSSEMASAFLQNLPLNLNSKRRGAEEMSKALGQHFSRAPHRFQLNRLYGQFVFEQHGMYDDKYCRYVHTVFLDPADRPVDDGTGRKMESFGYYCRVGQNTPFVYYSSDKFKYKNFDDGVGDQP